MMLKIQIPSFKGKRGRVWLKTLLLLISAGILSFGLLFGLVMQGAYDHIDGEPEVMLILGCQVKPWGPSILLQDRLDTALDYLEEHPDMTIIVSGGQGPDEPTTEAQAMADYLTEQGISSVRIFLEEQSHNTAQNFRYSRQLMEDLGYDPEETELLVVSNGFHLTRSRMLAGRTGFEEVSTLAAPSSHLPSRLKMYVREPLALVKSFLIDR